MVGLVPGEAFFQAWPGFQKREGKDCLHRRDQDYGCLAVDPTKHSRILRDVKNHR